ncbi:hypothetical protein CAPTEDRAFT_192307 [Capitella teleta]|uniref:Uncharacterized protein n=1 Tax=Capitella teleta TaxID=283909 RepID=R7UMN6_CAPTE|nr:hypothetical protein CAPTEDRAFT_192307 [Capitella teleta]|eukprot:ELU04512.1 hypothetical protein CAPTEDRAFT_192307 [Capitella teleta]
MAPIQSPVAVNHLFIGRRAVTNVKKNRAVVEGPNIAPLFSAPNFLSLQPKKSARPRNCSSDSYGSSTSSRMHSSGSDTYEAESDYTHVDSDTDIASMIEGDFSDAESGRKTPTEEDSAPFEANNNSLNKTPAKKPDQLPLNTITINDESVTPTRTNGVQAGIEIRKSPSSPEKATDEYVAHLTYKTQKHTLTDRLSPHSPPSSDSEGSRSRVFSPFVSQMMSRRRAQNGLKLGLYSADTVAKSEGRHPVNNLHPNSKPRK